jgi:chromate transporter
VPAVACPVNQLWQLAALFGQLSVLAVGGIAPVLPEMQRQVVQVHGYMDRATFAALYGLAQAAPGPNMLVSTLVGWKVAGVPGGIAATVGLIGPSSVLTYVTAELWHRFRDHRWRRLVQAGLVPVTVGLVCAGAALLAESTTTNWVTIAITLTASIVLVLTRVHPLLMLAMGAAASIIMG